MSLDFLSNLSRVIGQVSKEKGVSEAVVEDSIVQGVLSAVRKKYGTYRDIEVKYNKELGEIELFEFKKIVKDDEFEDELIEITYSEAKELDPSAHIGDQVGMNLELKDLGRIDAQAAKQIIIQNLRSIEHEIIFNEFEKRKGEITSGVVRRVDPGMIVVDLDKTEAYIPRREQIPGEQYKAGDRIQGYLLEVRQTTRGPQIIMSRTNEQYLIKLFENEVPELSEGIVKIVAAAREPGQRAKMSVYSTDSAVHPVGSCVGVKGSRVQNITQELKGERIDIIVWENDPVQYICNALAPAKISKILMDEDQKSMQIIVPDDQLSLAIGKKGQNVRLAVKLTGWNLNLVSEEESKKAKEVALFNLTLIPEVSETKAQSLLQYGFTEVKQIAEAKPEDLKNIPEFEDPSICKKLIVSAQDLLKQYEKEGKELPVYTEQKQETKPLSSSLKEQAEEILKRELAQLEEGKEKEEPLPEKESKGKEEMKKEKESAEKASVEKTSAEKESAEKESAEKASVEKESAEKESAEKASVEKESAEKESAEKESAEKESAEKGSAEKESVEKESVEKESVEKESAEKGSAEKESAEKESAEKASVEKESAEKESAEKESAEKESAEKESAEKESAEKESAEKESAEKESAEKESAEKESAEKESAEKASAEKGSAEKGSAEKASVEKTSAEKGSAEKASAEKASAEKESAEKANTDKASAEKEKKGKENSKQGEQKVTKKTEDKK